MGLETNNSSDAILLAGSSFTGYTTDVSTYSSLAISVKTDQDGTLFIDFSSNGIDFDSTLSYSVTASVNEVHRITVTRRFYRVRFTNTSVSNQTFFRLQSLVGEFTGLNSALNSIIQQDADAIITRNVTEELDIAQGKRTGYSIVNKFGRNPDVDTGTLPEDAWNGGGVYTGFPTQTQTVRVFSSSALDTSVGTGARTINIMGLDANFNQQSELIVLNGTIPVNSLLTWSRVNIGTVTTAGSGGVNAGKITCSHTTTTANLFFIMPIGFNQTAVGAYTVPTGYTAYMSRIAGRVRSTSAASADGYIWTRSFNGVFRARRPFTFSNASPLLDEIFGGLAFTEKTDLVMRITNVTASNVDATVNFDMILIKN